jgi:hypothetical protein
VSWSRGPGATHARLWRAETPEGARTDLTGWTTALEYDDRTGALDATNYYFTQGATDVSGTRSSAYSPAEPGYRSSTARVSILGTSAGPGVMLRLAVLGAPATVRVERASQPEGPFADTGIRHYQATNGEVRLYVPRRGAAAGDCLRIVAEGAGGPSVRTEAQEPVPLCVAIDFVRPSTGVFPLEVLAAATPGGACVSTGVGLVVPAGCNEGVIALPASSERGYYRVRGTE